MPKQDLFARQEVLRLVRVPLNRNQLEALTLWAADVLSGEVDGLNDGLETAQLLYHVNHGEFHVAGAELLKWCMVKGRFNFGALEKRKFEQRLFLQGVGDAVSIKPFDPFGGFRRAG